MRQVARKSAALAADRPRNLGPGWPTWASEFPEIFLFPPPSSSLLPFSSLFLPLNRAAHRMLHEVFEVASLLPN